MSWITSKIAGPIAGGLALILAVSLAFTLISTNAAIGELRRDKSALTTSLAEAKADLNQCRANRLTLEGAVQRQNAAVDLAKAEGDKRAAELARVADRARADAAGASAKAAAILARPAPAGDRCSAADALILENIR